MPKDQRHRTKSPERRSRQRKRIVVFIDDDSHTCDRVACQLEAGGYHVLTAVNLSQGLELVRVRTPDAVVWSDAIARRHHWTLCCYVRAQLPPQTRAVLLSGGSNADRDFEAYAGHLGVALVDESSDSDQLATVLDDLIEGVSDRHCAGAHGNQK